MKKISSTQASIQCKRAIVKLISCSNRLRNERYIAAKRWGFSAYQSKYKNLAKKLSTCDEAGRSRNKLTPFLHEENKS